MKKVKTVKMTVRQFATSIGLKKIGLDYLGTTVLMRLLCKKKIAKKIGKTVKKGAGRPSDIFEVPVEFKISQRMKKVA